MKCILTKCFLFSEYNMACTEPTLSITYDELLEHTKEILYTLRMYSNTPRTLLTGDVTMGLSFYGINW